MPANDLERDLALAHDLADLADGITTGRFRAVDLQVTTKPDLTPVTDADRAVEAGIRRHLSRARPGDAVLGEEFGGQADTAGARCWVVDPIDGTKNFVRGVPVWASLIALESDGDVVVGVASAPGLDRRWWAARGHGSFTGTSRNTARRNRVSGVGDLADAFLSYASSHGWGPRTGAFDRLLGSVWRTRAFGDFWQHVLVAEGALDVAAEPAVSLWDVAAIKVILEEAGGRFSDLSGRPGPGGGSVLCTNGLLHDVVLDLLSVDQR